MNGRYSCNVAGGDQVGSSQSDADDADVSTWPDCAAWSPRESVGSSSRGNACTHFPCRVRGAEIPPDRSRMNERLAHRNGCLSARYNFFAVSELASLRVVSAVPTACAPVPVWLHPMHPVSSRVRPSRVLGGGTSFQPEETTLRVSPSFPDLKLLTPVYHRGVACMSFGWVNPKAGVPGAGGRGAAVMRGPMVSKVGNPNGGYLEVEACGNMMAIVSCVVRRASCIVCRNVVRAASSERVSQRSWSSQSYTVLWSRLCGFAYRGT